MIKTIKEVVRMYFEPLTPAFWRRKPQPPSNEQFTANQQREIDTSFEQMKQRVQRMRQG